MSKKIILIIFGVLIILSFELSMRLIGILFLNNRIMGLPSQPNMPPTIICCVGDSHTFGVGTSHQYSYPKQLEKLLSINNPSHAFHIVNLGIPGDSTKSQVERLAAFLSGNKANIVILLTGRNNQYEVEAWKNKSFFVQVIYKIRSLRIYEVMEYLINRVVKREGRSTGIEENKEEKYRDYILYYLSQAKYLCEKRNCKLLLVSYYNSSDQDIENFARKYKIPFFNLSQDFAEYISRNNIKLYLSADKSHMNRFGYQAFSELLYQRMFLHGAELGLTINPLLRKIDKAVFYKGASEIYEALEFQKKRIEEMPNSPFELIHLGHIYMELREDEKAKECYLRGLETSGYTDNNTIVSPIINWCLEHNLYREAYQICQKIISQNIKHDIALSYLRYIEQEYPSCFKQDKERISLSQ